MIEPTILRDFERQIEEQYRLDREALRRLMSRYGTVNSCAGESKLSAVVRTSKTAIRKFPSPYEEEIHSFLREHTDRDYNAQELADVLVASGVQIRAKRPDVAIHRTVSGLIDRGVVAETAARSGRSARRFKWREVQEDLSAA